MDQSTLEIKKYIDNLVPTVKTAVLSPEWRKKLEEIGQKYSLHLDQISSLEYEVLFVMIGMEPEEDLVANIQKELSISKILATQLAEEINTRIFQYILKTMQAQIVQKPERFAESSNEIRDMRYEREKTGNRDARLEIRDTRQEEEKTVNRDTRYEIRDKNNTEPASPAPIAPRVSSLVSPLLSEMETMAGESSNETRDTRYENRDKTGEPKENQQKTTEPPANLPGESIDIVVGGNKSNEIRDTSNAKLEQASPAPIVSRVSNLVSPSFADAKLNNIVKSEQETITKEEKPKTYPVDPYREPIE